MQGYIENMRIDSSTFLVLDLDDTLYHEKDYQLSGFRAVACYFQDLYGYDPYTELVRLSLCGETDVFGWLCRNSNLPMSCRESLVWIYRNHAPTIQLGSRVFETLGRLRNILPGIAILTDGRSVTQRLKLQSLGLSDVPAYISEEYGDTKPGLLRFELIQKRHSADQYCYIGDNPAKDFFAPNALGWKTIGVKGSGDNVHPQDTVGLAEEYLPDVWINHFHEIWV